MKPPVFSNHGCRLNAYETEAMKDLATTAGVENAIIVNTCAVTAEAVRKAKQDIRKQRRDNPDAQIIVTGCAAQIEPATFSAMDEVNVVLGNTKRLRSPLHVLHHPLRSRQFTVRACRRCYRPDKTSRGSRL